MSNKFKFSYADIIGFVAIIGFGITCLLSMFYKTMGDSRASLVWTGAIAFTMLIITIALKLLKSAHSKFRLCALLQILFILFFAGAAYFFLPTFAHFFNVQKHKTLITESTKTNFDSIEKMFVDYKTYADQRIAAYSRNLQTAIAGKAANNSNYLQWGFQPDNGASDAQQKNAMTEMLTTDLLMSGFEETRKQAYDWLNDKRRNITTWRPITMINIINLVDTQANKWKTALTSYSIKAKPKNENAQPFSYDLSFSNVRELCINVSKPSGTAIVIALVAYSLMLFPWLVAEKDNKNYLPFFILLFKKRTKSPNAL
jgi:hypothetical protein